MKMDIGSSQSWWWESHNRPKHSKWLQENLGDVEANVQAMLTLIEGDADSFAQRAEMYYKKRPDLLKVVEQFYRGYRALAERYDQLAGNIRQMPSTIQSQYGLVSESPRASPFGKQMAFRKQGSRDTANSQADSNFSGESGEGDEDGEHCEISVDQSQDGDDSSTSSSCSDNGDVDEIQKLQQAVERLRAENKRLNDKSREKLQQYRETEKRLHGFREDFLRVQKENNTLKADLTTAEKMTKKLEGEISDLGMEKETLERSLQELQMKNSSLNEESAVSAKKMQAEVGCLQEENQKLQIQIAEAEEKHNELSAGLRFMRSTVTSLFSKNKALIEQMFSMAEGDEAKQRELTEQRREASKLVDDVQKLKSLLEEREEIVSNLNAQVTTMTDQVSKLHEENQRQRDAIAVSAEEKREAIRQLCFSMDLLNNRNQWLEELVLSAKSKLNDYHEKLAAKQGSSWRLFAA